MRRHRGHDEPEIAWSPNAPLADGSAVIRAPRAGDLVAPADVDHAQPATAA